MMPINFEGARIIGKPKNLTDEQCTSIYAKDVPIDYGKDVNGNDLIGCMWVECWQPSKEDIEAINAGRPIWLQIHSVNLMPVSMFTLDENGEQN